MTAENPIVLWTIVTVRPCDETKSRSRKRNPCLCAVFDYHNSVILFMNRMPTLDPTPATTLIWNLWSAIILFAHRYSLIYTLFTVCASQFSFGVRSWYVVNVCVTRCALKTGNKKLSKKNFKTFYHRTSVLVFFYARRVCRLCHRTPIFRTNRCVNCSIHRVYVFISLSSGTRGKSV
jgi:hypothetical protein